MKLSLSVDNGPDSHWWPDVMLPGADESGLTSAPVGVSPLFWRWRWYNIGEGLLRPGPGVLSPVVRLTAKWNRSFCTGQQCLHGCQQPTQLLLTLISFFPSTSAVSRPHWMLTIHPRTPAPGAASTQSSATTVWPSRALHGPSGRGCRQLPSSMSPSHPRPRAIRGLPQPG